MAVLIREDDDGDEANDGGAGDDTKGIIVLNL